MLCANDDMESMAMEIVSSNVGRMIVVLLFCCLVVSLFVYLVVNVI